MVDRSHKLPHNTGCTFSTLTRRFGPGSNKIFSPTHDYILNEMGLALIYPNVRGSSGYGKRYLAADDVEKREDAVK